MNCVLVIDDDPAIRRLAHSVLSLEGFAVHTASNGLEALEVMNRMPPSVILLDLQMPVMDGPSFFREIDGPERPPVVIMSAFDADSACRELGADACIAKPYNPVHLVETVKKLRGYK